MNYYQILDVPQNATQSEIKNAYRNMIKAFHPDYYRGANKEFAERKTKELNEAYEVLSNPTLREQYDNWLKYQTFTSSEERNNKRRDDSSESKTPNENSSAKENPNEKTAHTNAKSYDSSKDVKKGKKYPIVALLIIIAVAIIGFIFSNQTPNSNQEKYDIAVEMMEEGNYKEAEKILVSLGDFGDSKEQIINCRIMKADDLLKQGSYAEALGYYQKYADNPNVSKGKIEQCKEGIYQEGLEYYHNGEFDMAIYEFKKIEDYSNSTEMIEKCNEILEIKNN